jgi:ribosomal-protein-alanine acetyltransferase
MMSIRRARHDDLRSIVRIETKSFGRDAWEREVFIDYIARRDRSLFLVAIINGVVAGYALAWHSGIRAEIDSIAVALPHRGKGVAVALLKRLISVLRRRGFGTVGLNVRLDNAAAIGLYRRLGFHRVQLVNGYYADGASACRMRRSG